MRAGRPEPWCVHPRCRQLRFSAFEPRLLLHTSERANVRTPVCVGTTKWEGGTAEMVRRAAWARLLTALLNLGVALRVAQASLGNLLLNQPNLLDPPCLNLG